ncbi:MAG: hypothetical protein NDF52_05590 [archaeon YNP-WB-062]|nr:hypothetical protein [Candidatus Culexarchaeum yellowstonense]
MGKRLKIVFNPVFSLEFDERTDVIWTIDAERRMITVCEMLPGKNYRFYKIPFDQVCYILEEHNGMRE